jgi:hypothetical protein
MIAVNAPLKHHLSFKLYICMSTLLILDGNILKVNKNLNRFASINTRLEVMIPDGTAPGGAQWIVLDHYPLLSWHGSFRNAWHFHGHAHSALPDLFFHPHRYNVAVELNDYRPREYSELKAIIHHQELRGKSWEQLQIEHEDKNNTITDGVTNG